MGISALLVGLGSIGRRHVANLRLLEPDAFITVCHQHTSLQVAGLPPSEANRVVYGLDEALYPRPDIALVTSPAPLHVPTALTLAKLGIHLFVEKPLSHSVEGTRELLEVCRKQGLVLAVGYNFRFYHPLQVLRQAVVDGQIGRPLFLRAEVGQYLPDWRPTMDYRKTVSARRELGGGVVLELSHELDLAQWVLGEVQEVSAHLASLSDLEVDVEDTAEILLQFRNGALASVHLDMVQRAPSRTCRVVGTEGTLLWDGASHRVQIFTASAGQWYDLHPSCLVDRNEMYVEEVRDFLRCVRDGEHPLVSGEDGLRALEIALAAKQSAEERRTVVL